MSYAWRVHEKHAVHSTKRLASGTGLLLGRSLKGTAVRHIVVLAGTMLLAFTPGVVGLAAADSNGQVRTQSGKMRCIVSADDRSHGGGPLVVCQHTDASPFPSAPVSAQYNEQFNLAVVRGNGALSWDIGNIPGSNEAIAQDFVLTYGQPYHVNGWTVLPIVDGTRFTNDQTGHGMFINLDTVDPF
jgi:hypothetical protein